MTDAKSAITEQNAIKQLEKMRKDPRFIGWLDKGAPTKYCKSGWNNLSKEKKLIDGAAALAAAEKSCQALRATAAKVLKRSGKAIGKLTVVLPLAFIASDFIFSDKAFAVCVFDNGNPVPGLETEDIQRAIKDGQQTYSEYVKRGEQNDAQRRIRVSMEKNPVPGERPLPGECGCGK